MTRQCRAGDLSVTAGGRVYGVQGAAACACRIMPEQGFQGCRTGTQGAVPRCSRGRVRWAGQGTRRVLACAHSQRARRADAGCPGPGRFGPLRFLVLLPTWRARPRVPVQGSPGPFLSGAFRARGTALGSLHRALPVRPFRARGCCPGQRSLSLSFCRESAMPVPP